MKPRKCIASLGGAAAVVCSRTRAAALPTVPTSPVLQSRSTAWTARRSLPEACCAPRISNQNSTHRSSQKDGGALRTIREACDYTAAIGKERSAPARIQDSQPVWSLVAMRGTSENAFAFTASISAFCASASATPRGSSSLRWQYHAVYNALVRTHLSRSADVSATIGRDYVVDFVVGNRRPYAVHFNFVVVANHATLGRPTIH
jgi:hypothetical protein